MKSDCPVATQRTAGMEDIASNAPAQCRLLEGPVAIFAQAILCAFVLASLFLKRFVNIQIIHRVFLCNWTLCSIS